MSSLIQSNTSKKDQDVIIQWVTFKIDNEVYGINVMQVQEILRYCEIAPVPGAPEHVLGIINLRGSVVSVMDIRTRFDLPKNEADENSRIIIIEIDKKVIGILVDSVAEVVYLRSSDIEIAPSVGNKESSKFFQGVCNRDGNLLILLELNKLLDEDNLNKITKLSENQA